MTAWRKSKRRQIIEAIEAQRENSSQIARRLDTSPEYVRAVASTEGLRFPVPTHCQHCGTRFKSQRPGRYARSTCDDCKAAGARQRIRRYWQRQKDKRAEARA